MGDVLLRTAEKPGIGLDFVRVAGIGVSCAPWGEDDEECGEPLPGDAMDSQKRDIPGLMRLGLPMAGPKPIPALILCVRPHAEKWNGPETEAEFGRRNGKVAVPRRREERSASASASNWDEY